jgi:hypothetical protein
MSTFIEVTSVAPKNCKIIVNLDHLIEIAPLVAGGCVLYFSTLESGSPRTLTVSDDYDMFMQFVLQTVSSEDIQKRFPKKPKASTTLVKPQENGKNVELDIPVFGE